MAWSGNWEGSRLLTYYCLPTLLYSLVGGTRGPRRPTRPTPAIIYHPWRSTGFRVRPLMGRRRSCLGCMELNRIRPLLANLVWGAQIRYDKVNRRASGRIGISDPPSHRRHGCTRTSPRRSQDSGVRRPWRRVCDGEGEDSAPGPSDVRMVADGEIGRLVDWQFGRFGRGAEGQRGRRPHRSINHRADVDADMVACPAADPRPLLT